MPLEQPRSYHGGQLHTCVSWLSHTSTNVFPGFLTPVPIQLSFQSYGLLFLHASAEVRCENTPERKFVSNRYQTRNSYKRVLLQSIVIEQIDH